MNKKVNSFQAASFCIFFLLFIIEYHISPAPRPKDLEASISMKPNCKH